MFYNYHNWADQMELRDYQIGIIEKVHDLWDQGVQNVGVQLPTGAGKTVTFGNIVANHRGWSLCAAHRIELVSQISLTLARHGVYHEVIAPPSKVRDIVQIHLQELSRFYVRTKAETKVASVDTLVRMDPYTDWFRNVTLLIQDEAHHVLADNKWGKVAGLFSNARGLYLTATPVRADGKGLGRHADGVIDELIVGPPMRELINRGYLTDYRIYAPPAANLDLSHVNITATGEYNQKKLSGAVKQSTIMGDVVEHYKRLAMGKLGVTFAVDIESATQIANVFRSQGIAAEVISSKTPDLLRTQIMARFKRREILQIVNVDILGEGVDVPALEVVSFARPTQSYALYSQQFGRALRPLAGKPHAIIIDHVGNVHLHGVPDAHREWTLDRRERRGGSTRPTTVPIRTCLGCFSVFDRALKACPFCGHVVEVAGRATPELVEGDLIELEPQTLAKLRGEVERVDGAPVVPRNASHVAKLSIIKNHNRRKEAQHALRSNIAIYAGYLRARGCDDSYIYRKFYVDFKIDILSAQTLNAIEANKLHDDIQLSIDRIRNNE